MKFKKLSLKQFEVKSFVTSLDANKKITIVGGEESEQGCLSAGAVGGTTGCKSIPPNICMGSGSGT
ncbi:MAG: pinensin family lanthipeptide [Cyclobacteriaceae bacterium]